MSRSELLEQFCGDIRTLSRSSAKQDILAELERILASDQFRSSQRGSAFLKHIVENALACDFDSLKERVLGVELFGRDSEFDTDRDSVVRVAASDVRRRLKEFYGNQPASGVRIALRSGTYIPDIQVVRTKETAPAPVAEKAGSTDSHPRSRTPRWALAGLAMLSCTTLVATWAAAHRETASVPGEGSVLPFWSAILKPGRRATLVMADANLVIKKVRSGKDVPIWEYAGGGFSYGSGSRGRFEGYLNNIPLTTVSDALLTSRIAALAASSGCHLQVKSCKRLDFSELKGDEPIILLGSATSDPWVGLLNDQMNFKLEHRFDAGIEVCVNSAPRTGELAEYLPGREPSGVSVGYALIALVPNLAAKAPVLVIAGTSTESTEAAGELVTDPNRLAAVLGKIGVRPNSMPAHLELVVKSAYMSARSTKSEVVAFRFH